MSFERLVRQQRRRRRKSSRLSKAITRKTIDSVWQQRGSYSLGLEHVAYQEKWARS
jgi:hypothetical protein